MKVTYEIENGKKIKVKTYVDGTVYKYAKNGNEIYRKYYSGLEEWREYDINRHCIHFKANNGIEWFDEYYEARKVC